MNQQLLKVEPPESAVAVRTGNPIADMLKAVVEKGVTSDNVAAIEKLTELWWKTQERDAEKEFAAAFVELQNEMPNVKAMKPVPNNDGTTRYSYAPYEDIMEQVSPLLKKHGFTVSFSTDFKDTRLIKTCVLQHTGGHKRENSFAVRVGQGPPKANECQADGAASTYAKRFALCDMLNITIESDGDARTEGTPITPEQASELQHRVKMTNSNEPAFLKFCGVTFAGAPNIEHYKQIRSERYEQADVMLRNKEKQGK